MTYDHISPEMEDMAIALASVDDDPYRMTYITVEPGVQEPYGDLWLHYLRAAQAALDLNKSRVEKLEKEIADQAAVLADPVAVHLNMLRGGIAMPSPANIEHLYLDKLPSVAKLKEIRTRLDEGFGEPEYHDSAMGCGLEDRGIKDRYDAMYHGWERGVGKAFEEAEGLVEDIKSILEK